MVDPNDTYRKCRGDQCQQVLRKYPGREYSEIMFAAADLYYYLPTLKPATTYRFRCRIKTEDIHAGVTPTLNGVHIHFAAPGFNQHAPDPALRGTRD